MFIDYEKFEHDILKWYTHEVEIKIIISLEFGDIILKSTISTIQYFHEMEPIFNVDFLKIKFMLFPEIQSIKKSSLLFYNCNNNNNNNKNNNDHNNINNYLN